MGNMFYRAQPIDVIYAMKFSELKMWNEWHKLMCKEEEVYAKAMRGGK
jgi:hypothetical protein